MMSAGNFTAKFGEKSLLVGCADIRLAASDTVWSHEPLVWHCNQSDLTRYVHSCAGGPSDWVLLGETRISPQQDVGIRVGGDSGIRFLVLAYHYHLHHSMLQVDMRTPQMEGVTFDLVPAESPGVKEGAIFTMTLLSGRVSASAVTVLQYECLIREPVVMHPFAVSGHAHDTGLDVQVWKQGADGSEEMIALIENPNSKQWQQLVAERGLVIGPGDVIRVRCEYVNHLPINYTIG